MSRITLLCLAAGVFFACQDVQAPGEPNAPLFNERAADISVAPSGDMSGAIDADAIEDALIAAGPGDVIELRQGTFYIGRTLVAPAGFNGTLRGAGQAETTIMGVGTASAPFGNAAINVPGAPGLINASSFFFFPQPSGLLAVSDLAATLPDGFVTETNDWATSSLLAFFTAALGSDACDTRFENLHLQGADVGATGPPFWLYQPVWGIGVTGWTVAFPAPSSGGNHVVTSSELSKIGIQSIAYQFFKDARIDITENTFTDVRQAIIRWLDGADVTITENTMETSSLGAIVVTQEGEDVPGDRSNIVIKENTIRSDGVYGIEVGNSFSQVFKPDFNILIEENTIIKGDDQLFGWPNLAAIQIAAGEEGARVKENVISGNGEYAIVVDHVNNSLFDENDLQGFAPVEAHYGLIESHYNRLVLKGSETVLDLGTGNVIIRND